MWYGSQFAESLGLLEKDEKKQPPSESNKKVSLLLIDSCLRYSSNF